MGWGCLSPKPLLGPSASCMDSSSQGRSGTQAQAYCCGDPPTPGAKGVGVRGEHISKHLCLDSGFWVVGEAECCLGGPFPF